MHGKKKAGAEMSIMQQSSKAQDRTLGVWFQNIQHGMVKLPRFQRFEAWDRGRIASFLNTIINNLPVGVTLALEVAGQAKIRVAFHRKLRPRHTRHRDSALVGWPAKADGVLAFDA
jgi:hypothetical protein